MTVATSVVHGGVDMKYGEPPHGLVILWGVADGAAETALDGKHMKALAL